MCSKDRLAALQDERRRRERLEAALEQVTAERDRYRTDLGIAEAARAQVGTGVEALRATVDQLREQVDQARNIAVPRRPGHVDVRRARYVGHGVLSS